MSSNNSQPILEDVNVIVAGSRRRRIAYCCNNVG